MIANTYDCITTTAASRINRRICTVINTVNNVWPVVSLQC